MRIPVPHSVALRFDSDVAGPRSESRPFRFVWIDSMVLARRQKIFIVLLLIHWVAIFILTHIRIPRLVYEADILDKIPHFLSYLILFVLLWYATGPERKINWRKASTWWVFLIIVVYAFIDEWLQDYVGRNTDSLDFFANLSGMAAGMFVISIFTFWPTLLIIIAITIGLLTNLSRANLAELIPVINMAFHLLSYVLFTLVWIKNLQPLSPKGIVKLKWLIAALALPTGFLLSVKLSSVTLDRNFGMREVIISFASIVTTVAIVFLIALLRQSGVKKSLAKST